MHYEADTEVLLGYIFELQRETEDQRTALSQLRGELAISQAREVDLRGLATELENIVEYNRQLSMGWAWDFGANLDYVTYCVWCGAKLGSDKVVIRAHVDACREKYMPGSTVQVATPVSISLPGQTVTLTPQAPVNIMSQVPLTPLPVVPNVDKAGCDGGGCGHPCSKCGEAYGSPCEGNGSLGEYKCDGARRCVCIGTNGKPDEQVDF